MIAKAAGVLVYLGRIDYKEKFCEIGPLFYPTAHELKTPISAILMSLKLLEDKRVGALNEELPGCSR